MFTILILIALLAVCCFAVKKYDCTWATIPAIAFGVVLFLVILVMPIRYATTIGSIVRFNACKETVKIAREDGASVIERAALVPELVRSNKWLAAQKYWNSKWYFDEFIPDKVDELEPIR